MRRIPALLIAWAVGACSARGEATFVAPPGTAWVVLRSEGASSGQIRAVGLDAVRVELPSEQAVFADAYRSETLASLALEDGMVVRTWEGCGPTLPESSSRWILSPDADAFSPRAEAGPGLAPDGVDCAPPLASYEYASRYSILGNDLCTGLAAPRLRERCLVDLPVVCPIEALSTPLRLNGELCLGTATVAACRPLSARPEALFAMSCPRADGYEIALDFYAPATPRVTITASVSLAGGREDITVERPGSNDTARGWVSDLVLFEAFALVLDRGAVSSRYCSDGVMPTRIHTIDLETVEVVKTTTTVPCLRALTRDRGAGFLGAFDDGAAGAELGIKLGRFDPAGRLIDARLLPRIGGLSTRLQSSDLVGVVVTTGTPPRVAVVLRRSMERRTKETAAAFFDLATLDWQRTIVLDGSEVFYAAAFADGRLILSDNESNTVFLLDPEQDDVGAAERFTTGEIERDQQQLVAWPLPRADRPARWLVSKTRGRERQAYVDLVDPLQVGSARVADRFGYRRSTLVMHTALVRVPGSASRFVAGTLDASRERQTDPLVTRGTIAILDLDAQAFLPSPWVVGVGPVIDLDFDRQQRLWALLPWSAVVVRASLEDP
ncbi:MAG: hypothetical protein IT384_33395 [Deltaproteobacteria bacterium]|nr:hypothetical protein [Deltaproteobacteria bacterium]